MPPDDQKDHMDAARRRRILKPEFLDSSENITVLQYNSSVFLQNL